MTELEIGTTPEFTRDGARPAPGPAELSNASRLTDRMRVKTVYRRVVAYVRPYVFPFGIFAVISMLALSAVNAALPLLVRRVVDGLASSHVNERSLHMLALAIFAVFIVRASAKFGADYLSAFIEHRVLTDLRCDANGRLQRMPVSFFDNSSTAQIYSRVLNDAALAADAATDNIFTLIGDGSSLFGLTACAIYLDWRLALAAMLLIPAAVIPVQRISARMRHAAVQARSQLERLSALLFESLYGCRIVRAFGMERFECDRIEAQMQELQRSECRVAAMQAFTGPAIDMLAGCGFVAAIWFGTYSVMTGERTVGQLASFLSAIVLVYEPFKRLVRTNSTIQQGIAAADRVFEVIDHPGEPADAPNAIELRTGSHCVTFDNVWFRFADTWVLREANLTLRNNEMVALVGMSGAGKTAFAELLPRFYDVVRGSVAIDGIDVRRYSLRSLRAAIGIVTQTTFLFNDTVRANIAYGQTGKSFDQIVEAAQLANAHDFIMQLPQGYETIVGEIGLSLSGGQRQRLGIARALLKDAPILILDEATSELDAGSESLVHKALGRLVRNRTTLLIAHRLASVRRADRVAVLVDGAIGEVGAHDDLIARSLEYRRLFEFQLAESDSAPRP